MKRKSTCLDASVLDLGEYLLRSEPGKILLRRGYVVIPHCIPKQQIAEHVDSVKQLSLHQTPNDHNNGKFHGNCTDPRLVHCEASWITRLCTLPSFASILGMPMTDIVLSVDGVAIGTQACHRKESNAEYTCDMPYWVHVDVSAKELLTSEFRAAAHVQGYLCGSGGSSPEAHSTYLRVPHGGDVQSWVDDLRHYFQDDLKKYPKSSSTSVYFRHIPECMMWIQWTTSGVKPVLQDGDLLLWLSALPHAATAGPPNPDLESWRRTQQRVGWFITSHLKTLCPTPDLLRQRPFKIIDGTVQGHRIFTTRCVMGEAHPQSVEDNSAAQQSSPHDEPKNLYLLTGHSHEAFDELFANSARLQRQSTLQPLRTCLGDASLVETSSAAPSPNLVETSSAAKQTSPRPSKRAKTNGAIDEAEAKDTTRQMLTEHCATCKIETYKRPATQTVEEFLEWTYSCVATTLPDVMGTQAKFLDPSMCDDAGAGAECGDDCTVSTERDATPSTTHDAKRVKKFLPPGTWAGMWRLYYAMESFRHRKPASFTTFMRCIHTKKWASLLAIRNKPNW